MNNIYEAIKQVERYHFRSAQDTGGHPNALVVMNSLRTHLGLPMISKDDLPAWDEKRKGYYMPRESKLLVAAEVILLERGQL